MESEKRKIVLPFLILGALLTGLTLVFPAIGFLEWLTMIPLFVGAYRLCGSSRYGLGKTYWYGFLTVLSYYFVIYHWFTYLYPLDFVGMDNASSAVVIAAGWLGLSLLQAIPGGLVFLFFKLLHRTPLFRRTPLLRPFAFSALWIVFEWSSTLSWTGVPWGRLCLGQANYLPILQSASFFGSYFISLLILLINGLLAYALLYRTRPRRSILCASMAAILLLANLGGGLALMNVEKAPADTVNIGVVQGNINSHDKWSADSYEISKEIYGDLTRKAAAEGAEMVVWPETSFPYTLNRFGQLREFVKGLAKECNVTLIVGALYTDENDRDYNVLYQIEPDGTISENVYAKRHLVPFGEYVPMRDVIMTLIPPLANLSALGSDLTPGADPALFETEWGKMGGLICFDSIYEELALDSVRYGAGVLLLSSNDSWFYDSAAIYQHERQAMLRAIETGRYLVRSGNTGISTVITEKGEHKAWVEALEQGHFTVEVEVHTENTLYTTIGNVLVYLCLLFYMLLAFWGLYLGRETRLEKKNIEF